VSLLLLACGGVRHADGIGGGVRHGVVSGTRGTAASRRDEALRRGAVSDTAVCLTRRTAWAFESKSVLFESKSVLFESKSVLFESKSILFESKSVLFESKSVLFESKSVLFESKSVLFESKSVLFESKSVLFESKSVLFESNRIALVSDAAVLDTGRHRRRCQTHGGVGDGVRHADGGERRRRRCQARCSVRHVLRRRRCQRRAMSPLSQKGGTL
jgi:hypothetical protein